MYLGHLTFFAVYSLNKLLYLFNFLCVCIQIGTKYFRLECNNLVNKQYNVTAKMLTTAFLVA